MADKSYYMLIVSSDDDIILATESSCFTCLQNRRNFTILKNYGLIQGEELLKLRKLGVKILNADCNC